MRFKGSTCHYMDIARVMLTCNSWFQHTSIIVCDYKPPFDVTARVYESIIVNYSVIFLQCTCLFIEKPFVLIDR